MEGKSEYEGVGSAVFLKANAFRCQEFAEIGKDGGFICRKKDGGYLGYLSCCV